MNKNSKVLALKYRPQTFKDLIGQKTIAETIINSIRSLTSSTPVLLAASISSTSIWLESAIDLQLTHKFTLH